MTAPPFILKCRRNRPENVVARMASWIFVVAIIGVVIIQVVTR